MAETYKKHAKMQQFSEQKEASKTYKKDAKEAAILCFNFYILNKKNNFNRKGRKFICYYEIQVINYVPEK